MATLLFFFFCKSQSPLARSSTLFRLDQIQLMANDSCKMAWINLIYLRKNWQSEGQRINKSWQWVFEANFFFTLRYATFQFYSLVISLSLSHCVFLDKSISFNLVVVASVRRLWWRIINDICIYIFNNEIGSLCRLLAGSIQFQLIIEIVCIFALVLENWIENCCRA